MKSLVILQHQYRAGTCSIQDLANLVEQGELSKEAFFRLTRYNYQGFREVRKMDLEKA